MGPRVIPKGSPRKVDLVQAALEHAAQGRPVFPCKQDKTPLTARGFKDASKDPKQIQAWWQQWPDALIGMPTGRASGIDVLDIDVNHNEYTDGFKFVKNWPQLSPVLVRTPRGGAHVWFKSDGKVHNSTDNIAPGVDTKGTGGYVIVPPSYNAKGAYVFVNDPKPYLRTAPSCRRFLLRCRRSWTPNTLASPAPTRRPTPSGWPTRWP